MGGAWWAARWALDLVETDGRRAARWRWRWEVGCPPGGTSKKTSCSLRSIPYPPSRCVEGCPTPSLQARTAPRGFIWHASCMHPLARPLQGHALCTPSPGTSLAGCTPLASRMQAACQAAADPLRTLHRRGVKPAFWPFLEWAPFCQLSPAGMQHFVSFFPEGTMCRGVPGGPWGIPFHEQFRPLKCLSCKRHPSPRQGGENVRKKGGKCEKMHILYIHIVDIGR